MAGHASSFLTLVFLTILIAAPTFSGSFFPSPYRTLVSLGHSLMTRVANLRASRGDHSGADRARAMAETLEQARAVEVTLERGLGLGLEGIIWSTGWNYFKNYAWGEMNWRELNTAVPERKELLRWATEFTRMESDAEREAWLGRNYQSVLRLSNSMLGKLLQVFHQSGAWKEGVEAVKKEVVEGELLRDCLESVSNDLKGLFQVRNVTVSFHTHILLQLQLPPASPIFKLEIVEICINEEDCMKVVEGELLKNYLEWVSNDLKGLFQVRNLTISFHAHLMLQFQLQLPATPPIFKLEIVEICINEKVCMK